VSDLVVYDSEGYGIGEHSGQHSERIQKFFFDGVRLTLDASGPVTEMVVFFRARESETSRSEQYYALYRGDPAEFNQVLTRRVEQEYDMSIVTTTEDTDTYTLFDTGAIGTPPDTRTLDRAAALLASDGRPQSAPDGVTPRRSTVDQVQVGTGIYEAASQVVRYFLENGYTDTLAIAENVDSPHLEEYDLVVEKGSHDGIQLLGGTAAALEQRRPGRAETETATGRANGDDSRLPVDRPGLVGGVVAVLLLVAVAWVVGIPFLSGDGVEIASAEVHGADGVLVDGSLDGVETGDRFTVEIRAVERDETVVSRELPPAAVTGDEFSLALDADTIDAATDGFDYLGDTAYEVVVTADNSEATATVERAPLHLDLEAAEWVPDDARLDVTGSLRQGEARVNKERPELDVTLAASDEDTLLRTDPDYDADGGLAFSIADEETSVDFGAGGDVTVTAAYAGTQGEVIASLPSFGVEVTGTNSPVIAGETVDVTLAVTNTGGADGTETVRLAVGDLAEVTREVGLAAGESETVTLSVETDGDDTGAYDATVTAGEAQETTGVEIEAAGGFAVDVTGVDNPVEGDQLAVTVAVENTGGTARVGTVTLDVPGLGTESVEVELDAGESATETLTLGTAAGDAGEYTATVATDDDEATASVAVDPADEAALAVDITDANDPVTAGDSLQVTVEVTNEGGQTGTQTVTLDAGDLGTDSVEVSLDPGASATETLTVDTASGDVGAYAVTVSTDDDADSDEVLVRAEDIAGVFFEVDVTSVSFPTAGDPVEAGVEVTNFGDSAGEQSVTAAIPGIGEQSTTVQLDSGGSTGETFSLDTEAGDAGEYTATIESDDDETTVEVSIDPADPDPAAFAVDIAGTNDPVAEGEDLDVTAAVENVGDETGEVAVGLDVPGLGGDETAVDLGGGASETVTLTVGTADGDAGGYTATLTAGDDEASTDVTVEEDVPAFLAVEIAETNDPITEGEDLAVTVAVENTGDQQGVGAVTLDAGDLGTDSTGVELDPGGSTIETLTVGTEAGDAGEYTAAVATDDDEASTGVTVTDPEPAEFAVEITDTNSPVTEGEDLDVTVAVENTGDQSGEETVTLDAGGLGDDETAVDLDGGASETVTLSVGTGAGDEGEYNAVVEAGDDVSIEDVAVEEGAATSALSALDIGGQGSSATITEGEDVPVDVTVENVGTLPGGFDLELEITLGSTTVTTESESTGTLAPGESETVTFTGVTDEVNVDGEFSLGIETDDDAVSGDLAVESDESALAVHAAHYRPARLGRA